MAKLETLKVCQIVFFFSALNFFMHMFARSLVCMQNIEEIQLKPWEELIIQRMHYQPLFTRYSRRKMAKLETQ